MRVQPEQVAAWLCWLRRRRRGPLALSQSDPNCKYVFLYLGERAFLIVLKQLTELRELIG
jgi:hypothetical protein